MSLMRVMFLVTVTAFELSRSCNNLLPDGSTCGPEFSKHPDPESCKKFWQCVNGCAELVMCPDGFEFDAEMGWCDDASNVDCDRPASSSTSKPEPATTTTAGADCGGHILDCSSLPGGWYADPYNCRKYWQCDENLGGFHHICEEDYLYDPNNRWCDFPDRVDCGGRPICDDCDENCEAQTTVAAPTTTTTEDVAHCSEFCKSDWGDFELECCSNVFCKCERGVGYYYNCQPGLVFVEWKDQCDFTSNVACCNH